jgi:hypothetical protein
MNNNISKKIPIPFLWVSLLEKKSTIITILGITKKQGRKRPYICIKCIKRVTFGESKKENEREGEEREIERKRMRKRYRVR